MAFIRTITKASDKLADKWEGTRNMVDLYQLVLKYYYHPLMKGSNSIKQVLPAVLNDSPSLQNKYSQPIYGGEGGITSLNFKNSKKWVEYDEEGMVRDPYKLLDGIFKDYDDEAMDNFLMSEEAQMAGGGAAMMAYAYMQFSEMPDEERKAVVASLLRYCELDTLAMVMIWEHWNELIS